jgi:hypothetical protein
MNITDNVPLVGVKLVSEKCSLSRQIAEFWYMGKMVVCYENLKDKR